MIERLKTLTLMQLKNKKGRKVKKTKTNILVYVLLQILLIGVLTGVLWFVITLMKDTNFLPIDSNFMLFTLFITQILSILTCIIGLVQSLYSSKDNTIIFSLPARPTEVYISKLIVYYISEFIKNLNFIIPFLLSFGIALNLGVWYYFTVILNIFLLPLFAVLIGAVVSLPIMYISKLIKRFPYTKFILVSSIVAAIMWLLVFITNIIPRPLRILAIYGQFTQWVRTMILQVNSYSMFYNNIMQIMLGTNFWWNFLIVLLILLGFMGLTIAITLTYFKIVSQNFEYSSKNRKKGKNKVTKNTFLTFIKRELLLNIRNIQQLTNNFIFIVSVPFAFYLLNQFLSAINTSLLGNNIVLAINVVVGLLLLTASNTISATAISSEGSEFSLLKTAPSKTSSITWAKLTINFTLSLIAIIMSSIILNLTTSISTTNIIIIFYVLLTINTAHMFWAFQLDLLNPRLNEYATTGSHHDNPNISKSILNGLILAFLVGGLSFIIFDSGLSVDILKLVLICLGFLTLRVYLFILNLNTYFKNIQF